ncbi:AI-2E family transporter [Oecophyllibacter saccharovorans]|uniref:AI-2E family transporter n=1 Tax=Oecophyllibacter saccharovorans TaxID=2558360 RepID=A0A506UQJ7_9PROT|nr:AI-2E family transporter [Oecophyllibacter saccharovorans]
MSVSSALTRSQAFEFSGVPRLPSSSVPSPASQPQPSATERRQKKARFWLSLFIVAASLYILWSFLGALAWAGIFAICAWPLYRRMQKWWPQNGKWNSTILPTLATTVITIVLIAPLCYIAVKAAQEAMVGLPYLQEVLKSGLPMPDWVAHVPVIGHKLAHWWHNNLETPHALEHLLSTLNFKPAISVTQYVAMSFLNLGIEFSFATTALYFVLKYGDSLIKELSALTNCLFGQQGEVFGRQVIESVYGTLMGLVVVGLGEGALIGVLYIMAGAPQPLALAFMTGIGSMIPFLGGIVLAICCLIISFHSLWWGIGVYIGGYTIMSLAGQFLRPMLVGGKTNLPFLWALFGILGGIACFGLLGLFIGPAVMACMNSLWRSWMADAHATLSFQTFNPVRSASSPSQVEGSSSP